ncbi:uncharacterized protein LOC105210636 [Zeugodacus cucurbitae]|uniref:uncharacterized protein LOC105210636 n=1 Tax=Zeugodacus cucurbitae TaxID=28588 RepID=UPI0010A748C4|nr:uncharacterized protein LOC105210636 [Zeugodacus cucurbitae]
MKLPANAPLSCNFLQIVVIVVVVCTPIAWGWRSFKVIFTSFPYTYNSDVLDAKVQIQNSTSDTYLSVVLQVNEDLDDVYLKYAIALELEEGNYTTLVNRSVNFCKFLKQHSMDPILRIIYEDMLKQGNFIKKCPIAKGQYTVREYRIDEEMLPSYVPEASFFAEMKMTKSNGQELFDGKLYGKIDKSKGFNNLKMFSLG